MRLDSNLTTVLYKSFTYLLTYLCTHLIAKAIKISHAKLHYNRRTRYSRLCRSHFWGNTLYIIFHRAIDAS